VISSDNEFTLAAINVENYPNNFDQMDYLYKSGFDAIKALVDRIATGDSDFFPSDNQNLAKLHYSDILANLGRLGVSDVNLAKTITIDRLTSSPLLLVPIGYYRALSEPLDLRNFTDCPLWYIPMETEQSDGKAQRTIIWVFPDHEQLANGNQVPGNIAFIDTHTLQPDGSYAWVRTMNFENGLPSFTYTYTFGNEPTHQVTLNFVDQNIQPISPVAIPDGQTGITIFDQVVR
jgi:hypothetical protein